MAILYAGGEASGEEVLLCFVFLGAVVLIAAVWAAITGPAHYDVVVKGGAPYCPNCNRQVSLRRDHCRSCGYHFVSYGPTTQEVDPGPSREERAWAQYEADRQARREARKAEREAYYRSRGVEPGRWAWFKILPDWQQAIALGLTISIPAVLALVLIFRADKIRHSVQRVTEPARVERRPAIERRPVRPSAPF